MKKKWIRDAIYYGAKTKTWKIMRLSAFFLFLFISQVWADTGYAQQTKLTMKMDNAKVIDVLDAIENNSEFYFLFNQKLVDVERKVDVDANNKTIDKILTDLFAETGVHHQVKDRLIILTTEKTVFNEEMVVQQQKTISGAVTDEAGQPLPGVTVVIKGTTNGTVTNMDGNFTISNVPENATLKFSFVGMLSQEIEVGSQITINITMASDAIGIEEVVAVGYGTQSKESVSTAIATVKADKLENLPLSNVTQALVGQTSGIWLQQSNGEPGSAPNIRIRGNGSITSGNNPLFVVDGFPMTAGEFNAISPNDIESVDILKDAASAAIYGSKAGNGVILVTTKKGKAGKTKFTFNSIVGFDEVSKKVEVLNAEQYVNMATESLNNQGKSIPEWLTNSSLWEENDWQDVIFRKAQVQNYQLGASGGNENIRFNLSLGYLDQQGILESTYMKRYNFKADIAAKLNKYLSVGCNFLGSYTEKRTQEPMGVNTQSGVGGVMAVALSTPPIIPIWRDNGDYFIAFQDDKAKQVFNPNLSNPLNKLDANKAYDKLYRPSVSAYIELKPMKGLQIRTSLLNSIITARNEMYIEPFLAKGGTNTGNISTPDLTQIRASRGSSVYHSLYWSNTATYNFSLIDHNFTALIGYDVSIQNSFSTYVTQRTDEDNPVAFDNAIIKNVQGSILKNGSSESSKYTFDGAFGRLNYDYKGKYLITASIRRDRSSRFGPDNRSGVFSSVSGGWNITKEDWNFPGFLSLLKIRASYGVTGNDQVGENYPWISTLNKDTYVFGANNASNQVVTYLPSGFTNTNLGWEKNKQTDVGLDLGLLNNRLSFIIDAYERNSNTIFSTAIPSINGKANSAIQNVGNIRNRGFELMVNSKNLTNAFKWNTNFNISFNKNVITELSSIQNQLPNAWAGQWGNVIRNIEGRPMGDFYMYVVEGTFNNEEDLEKYAKFGTQFIGDLRYKDYNKDGKITPDDMELVGNYQPNFYYGFENTFSYKGFDLSILLNGSYGGEIVFALERGLALGRARENNLISALGRWKSESEPGSGYYHKAGTKALGSNIQASDRYLYDASFLRIRNLTFGYNIPAAVTKKYGIQNLRFFLVAQNLYTFTKYPGYNPEANKYGDNAIRNGVDEGSYPLARNFSLGINVSF